MWIKEVYTIGFDPVAEYELIKEFKRNNDMRDWVVSESTVLIAFTRTKSICIESPEHN